MVGAHRRAAEATAARFLPERQTRPQSPAPDLRLLVAAVKRAAMEWIAEKATELGVGLIQPVFTRRSVADRVNTARLAGIAREAAEQCRRLTVPRVAEASAVARGAGCVGWDAPAGRRRAARLAAARRCPRGAAPCRWPGWSGRKAASRRAELDDLRRRPFVATAALGPRILRAETAAVAGLAVVQALAGDWNDGC